MLRTIAISLILVLSIGIMMPFTNSAHGVRQSVQIGQKRNYRHRSKAWWKRYRARLRQKRAAAALAHRNKLLALPQNITAGELSAVSGPAVTTLPENSAVTETMAPPAMVAASVPVAEPSTSNGETRPRVVNSAHPAFRPTAPKAPGQMNLAVVALARPNPAFLTSREEKKMLGGVAVGELRRIVIDKMVASGGWVVNDVVREVNGARLFIVTARTPKDALTPEKAWTFYFTEAGGRIYALTTDSPVEFAERMTVEAERFIESLRKRTE
jgi:hypothetical protein